MLYGLMQFCLFWNSSGIPPKIILGGSLPVQPRAHPEVPLEVHLRVLRDSQDDALGVLPDVLLGVFS